MNDETLLTTELNRRADRVVAPPLSFEDVRGRAHGIRRRRRAVAAGAVAAVVALVVLVPTVLTGGSGDSDGIEPAPAPPVAPGASVLHDGTLTLPDGDTVEVDVDNADVSQLGVLTDGRIVLAMQQPHAVRVYAPDGTLEHEYPVQLNAITMSADDSAVAWVAEDLTTRVLSSGAPELATLPRIPMPDGSAGSIDAVLDADHLLVGDFNTTTGELTPDGVQELTTSESLSVTDVNLDGGLWAVRVDGPDPQFGCAGLYDPETDQVVARNCETSGLRFSPDGQHLLGLRGDNSMYGEASTFDLDLKALGSFESEGEGHVISRAAWADPTHLLVTMTNWKTNEWSLVRIGLDWAEPEVVDGPVNAGNPESYAEFLPSR